MKPVSGKDFVRILEHHGWKLLRIKGSHHIYGKHGSNLRLSIPVHENTALKTGLQKHLMKMAGLTENDLT
jgi:predicted RNA binding protein YcfA (HicA-like mRNA interferase family)